MSTRLAVILEILRQKQEVVTSILDGAAKVGAFGVAHRAQIEMETIEYCMGVVRFQIGEEKMHNESDEG